VVYVRFDNAPEAGIISAHSCLRAGYLDEVAFHKEKLTVYIALKLGSIHMSEPPPNEQDTDACVDCAFAQIKGSQWFSYEITRASGM
jgi:hypothetical protein